MNYIEIKCPCCQTILVIDRIDGKVIEERKPVLQQSTGDRFKDALIKSKNQKIETEKKFKEAAEANKTRSKSLEDMFKKSLKEVSKSDDKSKPISPFDFD
jgi:non-homologous end joining protein Ku